MAPRVECSICSSLWKLQFCGEEIGANRQRYSVLIRCPECRRLYESYGFSKKNPREISVEEAGELFPGVDPNGPPTKLPLAKRIRR